MERDEDPPHPLNARRRPPPAAPGARGPRPPRRPPPVAPICAGGPGTAGEGHAPSTFSRNAPPMPHAPSMPIYPPDAPRGSFLGGLLCQVCLSHQGPLGHAWLGTPGAPGHVCRGQPWSPRSPGSRLLGSVLGPSSRSTARSPPPLGAWLPRPGARPPLCPRPPCRRGSLHAVGG